MPAAVVEEEGGVEGEAGDEVLEQQKERLTMLILDLTPAHNFRKATNLFRTLTH